MKTTRTLILYIQSIWQTINRLAATAIAPRKLALILIVVFAVGGVAVKSKSFLINRLASKSAVALPAACSNQVTNGDFSSSLSGWTSSGAWGEHPGGGSAFTLLDGASNESLSQTINNLNSGPVLGQVTINFSIGSDDGGGVQTNTATLNISLNGTVYASFSNPNNSNTVTGTGQNGGSLNITSFTDNGVFNHGFQLTIPWVAQPNSAPLAFSFSSSSPIGDDFFVDNVVIDGGCPPPSPTLTKAFSPTSINAGSNSTLTFTIANSAGNPAQSGINFTDTFPANLKVAGTPGVVSSCGGAVTASAGSGSVSLSGGTMSGGMGSCTISVNVTSMVPGSNINGAGNISGLGNLLNGVTNQTLTVTVNADVSITKTNSTGIVTSGSTTTYSIVATNNGPGNANGAVISDPLPAGVSAFSWTCTASGGAICPNASGTGAINQTIATFPNGGSLIYTVTATISSTATGTVSNVATVTVPPGNTDPTPGDNTVTDGPDNVLLISDLSATNTNGVASVIPGTNSIYTVVFANGGPSQALGATLTDTLPLGITSANWTCAGAGGAVCPNANGSGAINETANIPSGGSLTYTMTVAVSPFAVGPFVSTATAALAAPATDPTPGNNSQTDSDVVFRDGDVDGVNDATDPDDDNDGILDVTEGRGVDPSGDADSDGLSNYGDPSFAGFVDGNNDGVNDNFDTDRDGIPDHLDLDADNDGIQDAIEGGGIDPDNDGRIGAGVIVDTDGDGLSNIVDADNGGTPLPIYNTDGAGDPDFQDLDADNDGIQDAIEGAGGITGDPDNDGRVGAGPVVDTDGDGWSNVVDSSNGGTAFPIPNSDGDAPALPDYRDLDADNDGIQDAVEGFGGPGGDPDNDGRVGAGPVVDTDGDGWSNVVDSTNGGTPFIVPNTDSDTTPLADYRDLDADNDGIQDAIEGAGGAAGDPDNDGRVGAGPVVDTDGDGWSNVVDSSNGGTAFTVPNSDGDSPTLADYRDLDADNDGIQDAIEGAGGVAGDPDNDGRVGTGPVVDTDGDGWSNVVDSTNGGAAFTVPNTDGDAAPLADYRDLDADNDGIQDAIEAGGSDSDNDGRIGAGPIVDTDGDGWSNVTDPSNGGTPLPILNTDVAGLPDYRDLDADDDGIQDAIEGGGSDADGDGRIGTGAVVDTDGDGWSNVVDSSNGGTALTIPNTDGAGLPDYRDLDADDDGIQDSIEGGGADGDNDGHIGTGAIVDTDGDGWSNVVDSSNGGTALPVPNTDAAGLPDYRDLDADDDGIQDTIEGGGADPDNDGHIGTGPIVDTDGDGWSNVVDSSNGGTPLPIPNTDGSGLPDYRDLDSDNDGINDAREGFGGLAGDPDGDGHIGTGPVIDTDGDGWSNVTDPTNGGTPLPIPNSDGVGLPDYRDLDADNDGIPDSREGNSTGGPNIDANNDGVIDVCADVDGDGLCDSVDPSQGGAPPTIPNTDGTGPADYRDVDSDGDGITDATEASPPGSNPDLNGDGRLDGCVDVDGDGLCDSVDPGPGGTPLPLPNTDGDGQPDFRDTDSDGDLVGDLTEANDANHNGQPDLIPTGIDTNGDGLDNIFLGPPVFQDTDGDGKQDWRDADDDADGIPTAGEDRNGNGNPTDDDTDGDGTPDYLDPFDDVKKLLVTVADPLACTGPGNAVTVTAMSTNSSLIAVTANFSATLPAGLIGVPGSCVSTVGACSVNATSASWSGTLQSGQSVTITYKAQVGDVPVNTLLCINSQLDWNGGIPLMVQACEKVDCPPVGPGSPIPSTSEMSGQKAGSILIYNVYTSSVDPTRQNTRINVTNVHPVISANVHLFFVAEGCSVADSYLCLTANQTTSFLASDLDPGTTGYLVAVAVDATGCPISFNYLIGDEYVKFASGHAANLNAEAIAGLPAGLPACDSNSVTATLNFDGVSYNRVPRTLATSSIGSRADGNDTLLILNRIGGNLGTGAATLGSIFGVFYDDTENALSFSLSGGCQFRSSISNTFPRITPRFENFVPAGRTGWFKLFSQSDVGITGAIINFNPNAAASAGAFNQGHNLHVLTLSAGQSYVIPVFPPSC